MNQKTIIKGAAAGILGCFLLASALAGQTRTCRVESRALPEQENWDSMFTALYAASDGRVYIGLNHHGAGANVAVYDPAADSMRLLGDMRELTGEKNLGREPQAKVHTQICEGSDGKIYFATHLSAWYNFAKISEPEGLPGGHWVVYDPKTDRLADLGIGLPRNGIITMTIDTQRQRLYGLTYPMGHLIYYDIRSRITTDMGVVQNWASVSRVLTTDDRGRVYGFYNDGRIWRYDPERDRVFNLLTQMPLRTPGIPIFRSFYETEHGLMGVARSTAGRKWYGLETESSYLFEYDPYQGDEGKATLLTQLTPDRYVGKRNVPYAMLAFCKDGEDVFYHAANTQLGDEPQGTYWGEGYGAAMVTYDLKSGKREDRGVIVAENSRLVMTPTAATCAPDGTVYFMAFVNEQGVGPRKSENVADLVLEKKGGTAERGRDYNLRLCIYKPKLSRPGG
jgi:hypothetical protein